MVLGAILGHATGAFSKMGEMAGFKGSVLEKEVVKDLSQNLSNSGLLEDIEMHADGIFDSTPKLQPNKGGFEEEAIKNFDNN